MFEIFKTFFICRVFIKYCVLSEILKYVPDSGLYRFPLSVSVCVHNGRSNTSTAAELAEFRKITSTIFYEHHVCEYKFICVIFRILFALVSGQEAEGEGVLTAIPGVPGQ